MSLVIEMGKIICSICNEVNWIFPKTKEEFDKMLCMNCNYPLSSDASFIDKIGYKYRKYFKVNKYGV